MAKIRYIHIQNFRAISELKWCPEPGLNCIVGAGDSGKTTIVEAIDLALGPRQTKLFSDTDFHLLNTDQPIRVDITLGDLADPLKNYEKYDLFLRGYDPTKCIIEDEPGDGLETVLTVRLQVASDLDPVWSLVSARAEVQGREKNLSWSDRVLLAGTKIGDVAEYHLSWRKGAVLNRIGDTKPNTTSAIAEAKRAARKAFGDGTQPDLSDVLKTVSETADQLGVSLDGDLQALLNAHSISLSGGTISVHDSNGLPLSSLGLGSSRLLVAGLLDKAKVGSNLVLADEIEYGLEPHRIMRFLDAIGAKDKTYKTQSFLTSHSPVVLRELSSKQLFRLCADGAAHELLNADVNSGSQGALRSYPEAFLSKSVILCEGASEVGFLRGFDQYFTEQGRPSIWASGVMLLDTGGVSKLYKSAPTLQALRYRVASFRDDDAPPDISAEADFERFSGKVFKWRTGEKIEAAIILGAQCHTIVEIVDLGAKLVGHDVANDQIKSVSSNKADFYSIREKALQNDLENQDRNWLIAGCSSKTNPWFKSVGAMEGLVHDVIAPALGGMTEHFRETVGLIFEWAESD